jgi:hypothetical protein
VYGREYGGRELRFEPSGGLLANSLIMMDKETDSYWSLMTSVSLAGEYKGTPLQELPVGEKTQWKDWVAKHPKTLVLSIDGIEHEKINPYENYFNSEEGFGGSEVEDKRLPTKSSIYAFHRGGKAHAVPFEEFEGGAVFEVDAGKLFLYRPSDVAIFYSTLAFVSEDGGFVERDGTWFHTASGARFDSDEGKFIGNEAQGVARLDGFDTFWFNWSMSQPDTVILRSK